MCKRRNNNWSLKKNLARATESRSYVCAYISYDACQKEVNILGLFPSRFWFVFITLVSLWCQRKCKREREVCKTETVKSVSQVPFVYFCVFKDLQSWLRFIKRT